MMDIAVLRAAGLTDEQIIAVLEAEQKLRRSKVRDQNRTRQQNYRQRNAVTRDERDMRDERDTPPAYTTPPKERKPKKVFSAKHALPTDFALSESDKQHAFDHGWTPDKLTSELARFVDHAKAGGRKQADWHAAWRNWVTSPYQAKPNGNYDGKHVKTAADVARELVENSSREASFDFNRVLPQIGRRGP